MTSDDSAKLASRVEAIERRARRILEDITDDPARHLRLCACGRKLTRLDCCVVCYDETLKMNNR